MTLGSPLKPLYAPLFASGGVDAAKSICSVVSQDPNHKSTSARSEAAASAARASEAEAARAAEAEAARGPFLASACEWASTRARPAACALKCALARAARRALAFAPLPPRPGRHARPWRGRRRRPAWREAGVSASSAGALGCIGVHCGDGNNLLLECYARPPLRCQAQEWTAALR